MTDVRRFVGLVLCLTAGCAKGLAGLEDAEETGENGGGAALDAGGGLDLATSSGPNDEGGQSGATGGEGGVSTGADSGGGGEPSDSGNVGDGCGDGKRNQDEVCDGADLDGADCMSLGYPGGALGCTDKCVLDTTACERPSLATTVETSEFDSSLDAPDTKSTNIQIMAPADLTGLVLGVDPLDNLATLEGTLTGSSGTLGTCRAAAMGGACDFSNLTLGSSAGGILTLSLTNTSGSYLDQLRIRIGAETGGITAPVAFDGTWGDSFGDTNYMLWPVGSATSSLSYAWTDTSFGSFSAVFRSPDGSKVESTDVFGPSTSSYPKDVSKVGWYLFGTSPYEPDSEGATYTFTVTAD